MLWVDVLFVLEDDYVLYLLCDNSGILCYRYGSGRFEG